MCNHRIPYFLGEISFGVFCLHMVILNAVFRGLDLDPFEGRFTDVFMLTLLLTLVAATAAYYLVERPMLRFKDSGPFAKAPKTATTKAPNTSS